MTLSRMAAALGYDDPDDEEYVGFCAAEIMEHVAALTAKENAWLELLLSEALRLTPLDKWDTLTIVEFGLDSDLPRTVACMVPKGRVSPSSPDGESGDVESWQHTEE